jgi:tRNA (guanine-N7-)-methyltransferase
VTGAPPPDRRRHLRSFGRIRSRTLKPRQAALMGDLLPDLALNLASGLIHTRSLKPDAEAVWLEVGFGGGEHMVAQAALHPQVLILGAEPFLNGAASAIRHIEAARVDNVRLHVGDVRDLIVALPNESLDRVFILFPDPWPKARHHKRRLIQAGLITDFARVLKPGGQLRFATDWADYGAWTLERFLQTREFRWTAVGADDWRKPPLDHRQTRYESKALGDIAPLFLEFQRV